MTLVEGRHALPGTGPGRIRALWEGDVGFCLRVYLAFRVGLLALAAVVAGLLPHNGDVGVPGWPAPPPTGWATAVTGWESADALWYLRIASQGYATDDGSQGEQSDAECEVDAQAEADIALPERADATRTGAREGMATLHEGHGRVTAGSR